MAILLDQVCRHLRCHGCWGVVQCRCFEIVASAKIVSTNGSGDLAASMGEHVWKSDQFFCFFCFERKMSSVGCANKRQKVLLFIEVKEFNLCYNQIFHVTSMSHFQLCIIAKLVEFTVETVRPFVLQPLISHISTSPLHCSHQLDQLGLFKMTRGDQENVQWDSGFLWNSSSLVCRVG